MCLFESFLAFVYNTQFNLLRNETTIMAVSYAPTKLRVPPGFQNLLEGLAREVLREQPEDIISFAAQYFKNKLVLREGKAFEKQSNLYIERKEAGDRSNDCHCITAFLKIF